MTEEHRPESAYEKAKFSSGGNMKWIILRGKWGLFIDSAILRMTGYSLMTKQYALASGTAYQQTLLLTTTGARTGQRRTCGLPYWDIDGARVVRGSNGGGATDPHWVHNIRKNADASIRTGWRSRPVKAHVASGEEREKLFEQLDAVSKSTSMYQNMCAPRELPLVVLREV
jgi:deazaflavin-dependent oxidoreductase (nitroreductase family)